MKSLLITGANRGIGYAIVEELLKKKYKFNIILTSRDEIKGKKSIETLLKKYPNESNHLFYHQLDIRNNENISTLCQFIQEKFNKIDYLINNAGVAVNKSEADIESFNYIFETNVDATINFTLKLIEKQLINKSGKIIMLGSELGNTDRLTNPKLKEEIKNAKTAADLFKLEEKYKQSILKGTTKKEGWSSDCWDVYSVSKLIINAFARVLSLDKFIIENNISAYVVWPGWVRTDMGGPNATYSIEEGIMTPFFVIDLPDGINPEYQGRNFFHCKLVDE